MKYDVNNWKLDQRWTMTSWAQANNQHEYDILVKSLFGKRLVHDNWYMNVSGMVGTEECYFRDDYESWHTYFETDCIEPYDVDEIYEELALPHPKDYFGKIRIRPDDDEFPCMLVFTYASYGGRMENCLRWNRIEDYNNESAREEIK